MRKKIICVRILYLLRILFIAISKEQFEILSTGQHLKCYPKFMQIVFRYSYYVRLAIHTSLS